MKPSWTFQDALHEASEAGDDMDHSAKTRPNRQPDPDLVARFHAAWLNVRRTIHRDFPDHYGDPDEHAPSATIVLADHLLDTAP